MQPSIERTAAKGGIWLAGFRSLAQFFSWAATIIVARILAPGDYGLMGLATILTGYMVLFSELGLGASIVQREKVEAEELSSLFWFLICWGFILSVICFVLAYPTQLIFNEPRILKVTRAVSVLFLIGSFSIVPLNIMQRDLRFKVIGFIETVSVLVACVAMLLIATHGGGVWTLILGGIAREFVRAVLTLKLSHWKPQFHFDFDKIKPYIKFGLNIAGAGSLNYICIRSDSFFGGKALGANIYGFYAMALQLSDIPSDKVVSLINSISFPVFSRYQKKHDEFKRFYLRLVNMIASITFPTFMGGYFVADELIRLVLGPKWEPMIVPFKLLCLAQLVSCINTSTGLANNAQGRPNWNLYSGIFCTFVIPASFFIAAKYGLNALVIPWITVIPIIKFGFTFICLHKFGVSFREYFMAMKHPAFGTTMAMFILVIFKHFYFKYLLALSYGLLLFVSTSIVLAVATYGIYFLIFQRTFIVSILNLRHA